ncbi:hypothetical protein [Sphingobacterium sp. 1.A.5]|uniref:hypothetical protein n=1 Tax=Sphingobacterium sp. 1.A.5 TaxID=2044604 RepID=UPI000C0BD3E6|nr:hypothetical protein [Sphingobacterium sp. 1.A.5]
MSRKLKLIDFDKAKNEIVREIAETQEFKNIIKYVCWKNGYSNRSQILDDVRNEVIEKMLKKDSEEVYNWYVDDPRRPVKVMFGIAKKQFLKHPKLIGYNKHSFGEYISFTSNLKFFDDDEMYGIEEKDFYIPEWQESGDSEHLSEENEGEQHVLYYLMSFLPEADKNILLFELDKNEKKGKYTKQHKEEKERIFQQLRDIAKEKNIKIIF